VNTILQEPCVPLLVAAVLLVVPLAYPTSEPELVANPRFVVQLVMSVATLAKIATTLPVTGAVLDVRTILV
jgi:hypothetical protein